MAAVYGVLGLIVVLTASSFGTINASPWFNLGIAVLFVVLGLAMFDVVNIDFSRFSTSVKTGGSSLACFYDVNIYGKAGAAVGAGVLLLGAGLTLAFP